LTSKVACQSDSPTASCPLSKPACSSPCFQDLDFQRINFESISTIVEIDVGGLLYRSSTPSLDIYLHSDGLEVASSTILQSFLADGSVPGFQGSPNTTFKYSAVSGSSNSKLPPASALAFLAKKQIPTVFISDYQSSFSNPYYNSEFDDGSEWSSEQITTLCGVATNAARSIYKLASATTSNIPPSVSANCTLLFEYLTCVTRNFACPLMQQFLPNRTLPTTVSSYSGVFDYNSPPSWTGFFAFKVLQGLFKVTNGKTCRLDSDCIQVYKV
jgi:hypothetical protein